jgi:hypothetical protein
MSIDKAVRAARTTRINISLSGSDDQILSSIKAARRNKEDSEKEVFLAIKAQLKSMVQINQPYPMKALVIKVAANLTDFTDRLSAASIAKHIECVMQGTVVFSGFKTRVSYNSGKAMITFEPLDSDTSPDSYLVSSPLIGAFVLLSWHQVCNIYYLFNTKT